jgi:hypothetical protein
MRHALGRRVADGGGHLGAARTPNRPELKAKRLGYLHLFRLPVRSYLEKFGHPKNVADMVNHRVVEQQTDQLRGYELDKIFGPRLPIAWCA